MSLVQSIIASYRNPTPVFKRMWAGGVEERTNLALVMGACVAGFVSVWPSLARQSYLTGDALDQLMGGALLSRVMMAPLMFYVFALILFWVSKLWRSGATPSQVRRIVFWALVVVVPLQLLQGLVAGFIGDGPAYSVVGIVGAIVMLRTLIAGFRSVSGD
jgi:hypothetical protein